MSNFIVRRYKHTDKEKVKKLYRLASIHSEVGYRSGPWEADFDNIESHFFDGWEFLLGLIDDEIVAIGGYTKKGTKEKEFCTEGGGHTFEVIWYRKQIYATL